MAEQKRERAERFGANLRVYIVEKYGSLREYMQLIYGKQVPGRVYPIMNGSANLSPGHLDQMVAAGVSRADILALYDKPMPSPDVMARVRGDVVRKAAVVSATSKALTVARQQPADTAIGLQGPMWEPPTPPPVPAPPPPAELDQFALVVGQDGRATLRLNLVNIPMKDALRTLHSLTAAGILRSDDDPKT